MLLKLLLSTSNDPIFLAIIGIPIGLLIFFLGFSTWNVFRRVEDTPTSKVRSMAAGFIELNGKVKEIKTLTSPVSQATCVYYNVEHQTYVRSKNGGSWHTTSIDTGFQNFYLQDETGKVEIDPRKAGIDIPTDKTKYYTSDRRDVECYLAPGDMVYTLGTAMIKPGVRSANNPENFIVTQGEGDKFFYISDKKEADVQKHLSNSAKIQIIIGGIILLLSLSYLVFRFVV